MLDFRRITGKRGRSDPGRAPRLDCLRGRFHDCEYENRAA
jgi:hypothetical protein